MLIRPVSGFGSLRTEFMRIGLSNRILSVLDRNTRKTLTRENLVIIRVVINNQTNLMHHHIFCTMCPIGTTNNARKNNGKCIGRVCNASDHPQWWWNPVPNQKKEYMGKSIECHAEWFNGFRSCCLPQAVSKNYCLPRAVSKKLFWTLQSGAFLKS
jgi:hypothetical protein